VRTCCATYLAPRQHRRKWSRVPAFTSARERRSRRNRFGPAGSSALGVGSKMPRNRLIYSSIRRCPLRAIKVRSFDRGRCLRKRSAKILSLRNGGSHCAETSTFLLCRRLSCSEPRLATGAGQCQKSMSQSAVSGESAGHWGTHTRCSSVFENPINFTHVLRKQRAAFSHLSKRVFEYRA
jgi:hypothetical protein